MTKVWQLYHFWERSYHNLNFIRIWPEKLLFLRGGLGWFKFNNLGVVLGRNLKFYTSVTKRLELKVRTFWGLIVTFAEVTEEKPVGGVPFCSPPSWIGLKERIKPGYIRIGSFNTKLLNNPLASCSLVNVDFLLPQTAQFDKNTIPQFFNFWLFAFCIYSTLQTTR